MKITPEKLHFFRCSPFPIKQPKNVNKRTDCGENKLSIQLANYLREMTLTGKCKAVWTKIAHETNSNSIPYGNLMRNMGKLAGVPDYIFTWDEKCLWLELKNGKKNKLSKDQEFFREWCKSTNTDWAIAYSLMEALDIIVGRGIIK